MCFTDVVLPLSHSPLDRRLAANRRRFTPNRRSGAANRRSGAANRRRLAATFWRIAHRLRVSSHVTNDEMWIEAVPDNGDLRRVCSAAGCPLRAGVRIACHLKRISTGLSSSP